MSKVIIKLDNSGNVILPTMVLATRSGKKLGTILTEENKLTASLENGYSLSFIVNKYLDGHENNVWDSIDNFKLLYIPDWDIWFEMYVSIAENSSIVKEVECTSLCEAELSQIMLYNIEINTETDISREDYEPTIIYNDKNPAASLLDRIMEKTPHYCIEHVDKSIAKLQRTFTFDGKSVRDSMHEVAEEINALLVLNSGSNLDGTITRGISLYDLEEHCEDCGYRGKSSNGQCPECGSVNWSYGYGEDSGIFISSENLSNDIKLTTDTDKIKNCFKLVAGDDLMTATVAGCCPNGIGYLWYLTEDTKNDMSAELRSRLDSYDRLTADIEKRHWTLSDSDYSALATKYGKEKWDSIDGYADLLNAMYDTIDFQLYLEHSMMPDTTIPETTAQEQMNKLVANLSPVAVQNLSVLSSTTATSYVAQAIRAIVDPRYSVTTSEETLNGNNWSGTIKLTRSSDETDTVTRQNVRVALNDDFVNYLKTLIDRTINTTKLEEFDIITLFDMSLTRFAGEIRKYSLTYLQTFYDAAQSCLNVLIERGAGNDSVSPEAYNTLYTNYYDKRETLQREITLREQEISTIEYKQNTIDRQINQVHDDLDLEKYLGEKLWLELAAYRREDTYKNDNFISDGLSNAELFDKAREFIERAKSDIENSNYGQHEITSSLYNLLLMPEFKKLYDGFALGNWLRIRVDGEIYLLRLIEYSLGFTNLQNINVVYSDVTEQNLFYNAAMDSESNYKSMASTYGNVSRQASHGNDSNKQLRSWVSDGLQATLTRFMSDAVNQNIMWDSNGLLFRRYDDITEDYSPEQLRIINSTIAVTDDNWKTVKTAVGGFDYLDPVTQKVKHGYGINAELLIGKLILGEELGLYNPSNSLTFDRNGLTITNGDNSFKVSPDGANLFVVECGKDNKVMWVDEEGGLHLKPTSFELSTGETIEDVANEVLEKFKEEVYNPEVQALSDSKIETWYQATDPSKTPEWRNEGETEGEANNRHEGDIWYDTVNQVYKRWNGTKWEDSPSVPPADMIEKWDGKKQIFYCDPNDADESKRHPNPPYDLNDLWVQGANGDILRCQEAKTKEQSYEADDWAKASKYTDDTNITAYVNTIKDTLQGQVDKKIETYYQTEDPSAAWSESEKSLHIGDIWYSINERIYKRWTGSTWEPTPSEPPEDLLDKWDKKKQIFYCDPNDANPANRHPNPPYWINDLWVQGDGGDILVCKDTRLEGDYISTDWQKACKYTDDTEITKYVNEEIERLQTQVDGKIETWYQATDPSKTPEWRNEGETEGEANNRHEGDIWYDTSDGSCERWNGNTWVEVTTKPPQSVFDSIDGKAQIFVGTTSPTTPYHEGDLWFKSETDPIYVSTATRLSGACVLSDWVKKDKYIDESGVGTIIDNTLTQEDVFNRLTGGGVNEGIYLEDGHIYINASYIKSGTITADLIKGGTLNLGGNNDQFGTLVIKNSSGAEIGRWDSDGISIKSGSLDASLIKTGKISADRIDTDSLYVSAVYTPNMYEFSKRQAVLYAHIPSGLTTVALYIGGDADNYLNAGRYLVSSMFLLSTGNIYIGDNTTTSQTNGTLLLFDIANKTFRPQTSSATWSFGTSTYPWKNGYISTANITSEYVTKTYAKTLFSYYSTSASSSSTYGIYITNNQIYSNYTSSSAKSYLGTSSHYWDYGYIDNLYTKSYVQIGSTSNSKVGFFGTTPVVRKSVSSASTSSNVTASSVATSLNALITALKGYGLIS